MPATYESIASYTVTGSNLIGTTGVTFSSIPSTYTDLVIVQNTKLTAPAINHIRVGNGSVSSAAIYGKTFLSGNGTAASSTRNGAYTQWGSNLAHQTSEWGIYTTSILGYSNTTTFKPILEKYDNVSYGAVEVSAGLWSSTSAINIIQLFLDRAEYYVVGSTFSLYGIKAA